jgi:IclR family transcriptional regulator, KDG regulon repressor
MSSENSNHYSIQVLQRALRILDVLLEIGHALSLEEIARRSQTPKSTTFRILTNFLEQDYVTKTDDGYWLGLKMISLGAAVEHNLDLRRLARTELLRLRDIAQETTYLAVLSNDMHIVYLDKIEAPQAVGVLMANIGKTLPMHCTALGKVIAAYKPTEDVRSWVKTHPLEALTRYTFTEIETLLTEFEAIRQRGYATDERENDEAIRCIAAPIRNSRGEVIAAISVAGPENRMPDPLIGSNIAQYTWETGWRISEALGAERPVQTSIHERG